MAVITALILLMTQTGFISFAESTEEPSISVVIGGEATPVYASQIAALAGEETTKSFTGKNGLTEVTAQFTSLSDILEAAGVEQITYPVRIAASDGFGANITEEEMPEMYLYPTGDGVYRSAKDGSAGKMWVSGVVTILDHSQHTYGDDHKCVICGEEEPSVSIVIGGEATPVYASQIAALAGEETTKTFTGHNGETEVTAQFTSLLDILEAAGAEQIVYPVKIAASDGFSADITEEDMPEMYLYPTGDGIYRSAKDGSSGKLWVSNVVSISDSGPIGWMKDDIGWWYRDANGSYPKNEWKQIDGKWYHFDDKGYMQTGWLKLNDTWYYLKSNGAMATGWLQIASDWYYFNDNGAMAHDTWKEDYYLTTSGKRAVDTWIGDYYVDETGKWDPTKFKEGWKQTSTGWWYQYEDGTYPKSEWKEINGIWYHFNEKGYMETGWIKLNDTWYYLKSSGAMVTGWLQIDSDWYYFNDNGAMAHDTWKGDYYLTSSGAMATNAWIGDYYVGENGKWVKDAVKG